MGYIDKVIMAKIPLKGGVSTEVKQEIKIDIAELIKGAVEATVSRMSPIPPTSTTGLYSATDVADMMKTTLRELLPDLVTTIREETEKSTTLAMFGWGVSTPRPENGTDFPKLNLPVKIV